MTLLGQTDVNKLFKHIPSRTLFHWAKAGLTQWSSEKENGRGLHRQYAPEDLCIIGLIEIFTDLNFPLDIIRIFLQREYSRPGIQAKTTLKEVFRCLMSDPTDANIERSLIITEAKSERKAAWLAEIADKNSLQLAAPIFGPVVVVINLADIAKRIVKALE
jgi:DNA-binding transcriptional MerR regulator